MRSPSATGDSKSMSDVKLIHPWLGSAKWCL